MRARRSAVLPCRNRQRGRGTSLIRRWNEASGNVRAKCVSSPGVGGVVDLFHSGGGDVGVDLGGAQVGVAKEFLDAAQVGSVVEEVGGEAVAQFVGANFEGDGGMPEIFLQEIIDCPHGDAAAELAEE